MNLCAILVKDFKKQKAKLKLNGQIKASGLTLLMFTHNGETERRL